MLYLDFGMHDTRLKRLKKKKKTWKNHSMYRLERLRDFVV